jgi:hypothetical protein
VKIRRFNGHKYRLADTVIGKTTAKQVASGFRKRGDNARIVKGGGGYQVWVRDIPSRRKALKY